MALKELLVATIFVFTLAVFMVVGAPTIDGVADSTDTDDLAGEKDVGFDPGAKVDLVTKSALVLAPTLAAIGFVIYAYAAIAKNETYRGRL